MRDVIFPVVLAVSKPRKTLKKSSKKKTTTKKKTTATTATKKKPAVKKTGLYDNFGLDQVRNSYRQ